jgi:glycosyltransferase involved in cell wall biosynthesis
LKKRVLQFIGSFHQGGTERQAVSLMRDLADDGRFEVFAATLNREGVLLAEAEAIGFTAIPEYRLTSFFNANFIRRVRECARYLRDNRIDIVHTHDFYTNVFGMAAAALAGAEGKIASKRETFEMRSKAQEIVEMMAFGRAGAILVNSEAIRDLLIARSVPTEKIHVIYNGLDVGRFGGRSPDPAAFGLPNGRRFVTIVANLRHRVKNLPMLLRTASKVTAGVTDADIVIAGEGELEQELRALAGGLGISGRTHFIGRCTDVPGLLGISDVCVLTSFAEGSSNSILEYMAAGKPVVATNVGGAAEAVIEGETGYLVASDDDTAMSARLIELLDDTEKSVRMGQAGRRLAETKFSLSNRLERTIDLYNSILDK